MMGRGMRARVRIALLAACALGLLLVAPRAGAVTLEPMGSFSAPLSVTSPPGDSRLFVVEREGRIQVVHDGAVSQFLDIHDRTTVFSERGLLSMAFDPNYATNGLFYVFYTGAAAQDGVDGLGHVDEFHVSPGNPNLADPGSQRHVLTISRPSSGAGNHNGGQLQFGNDGFLYVSVGDGGTGGSTAPDPSFPNGKILRIDPHGVGDGAHGIPPGNPYAGVPGAVPEIWGLGLRNPFRFSFDHLTGDLIIGDVGEVSHEEIDLSTASSGGGRDANYGWPCREGFSNGPGNCGGSFVDPVFDYPHSDPTPADPGNDAFGCAIIGGYVYRGSQAPEIEGRYLYADLCTAQLRSIQLGVPVASNDRAESAAHELSSARSFGQDSSCNLYVMNTTTVFRIVGSTPSVAPACALAPPSPVAAPPSTPVSKKKKCKKRHDKKKQRAAESKKRKKCKKKKKLAGMTGKLTVGG